MSAKSTDEVSIFLATATPIQPEPEKISGLAVYPNPVSGKLHIDYTSETIGKMNVGIYGLTGQRLITKEFEVTEGENTFQVDLSELSKGIDFLELTMNRERTIRKIVVE